jgi:hypothetical protein
MKIGTLVMLKYEASANHFTHKRSLGADDANQHGLGVVVSIKEFPTTGPPRVLVSFPKLGVEQWRTTRLLKVIA